MDARSNSEPLFRSDQLQCVELQPSDVLRLQQFLEANPEYYLAVNGSPPSAGEARDEFQFQLPPDWPFEKKWILEFTRPDGSMIGMAGLISNLFAEGIWHIGLLIVATPLHGSGVARALYEKLEAWMRSRGARWTRLGVVEGNVRAERFWERAGYVEVRRRMGVEMGNKIHTLRVMAKPLDESTLVQYLAAVPRDRPESP